MIRSKPSLSTREHQAMVFPDRARCSFDLEFREQSDLRSHATRVCIASCQSSPARFFATAGDFARYGPAGGRDYAARNHHIMSCSLIAPARCSQQESARFHRSFPNSSIEQAPTFLPLIILLPVPNFHLLNLSAILSHYTMSPFSCLRLLHALRPMLILDRHNNTAQFNTDFALFLQ